MRRAPLLLGFVGAAIVAAIIAGIMVAGSPEEARRERMDQLRLEHLEEIRFSISGYSRSGGPTLPDTLDAAYPYGPYTAPPTDPETGRPYEYAPLDAKKFELCAVFTSARPQDLRFANRYGGSAMLRRMNIRGPGRGCITYFVK